MINLNKITVNPGDTKINLTKKGDYSEINSSKKFHVKIVWTSPVDLDLHAFYLKKAFGFDKTILKIKKYISKLTNINLGKGDRIWFNNKGTLLHYPHIKLDKDAGVGDRAGNNEENMEFGNIAEHGYILVAVNIYNKTTSKFSDYNCKAIITIDGKDFTIPLDSKSIGSWAIIAKIDNSEDKTKIINMSEVRLTKPIIEAYT